MFSYRGSDPPHADHFDLCPPWGLSVPFPILLVLRLYLILRLHPALCGLVALLVLVPPSVPGGSMDSPPCFNPIAYTSTSTAPDSITLTLDLSVMSGLLSMGCRGLATSPPPPPGGEFTILATMTLA